MEIMDPRIDPQLVPDGSFAVIKAKHQQDVYRALPSVQTPDGRVISRWSPSDAERLAIARGEDLYLTVLTFNKRLQPVLLTVGVIDWTRQEA